jgi:hypothetical protein
VTYYGVRAGVTNEGFIGDLRVYYGDCQLAAGFRSKVKARTQLGDKSHEGFSVAVN